MKKLKANNKTKKKIHNDKKIKKVRKVIYDYKTFFIRKAVQHGTLILSA